MIISIIIFHLNLIFSMENFFSPFFFSFPAKLPIFRKLHRFSETSNLNFWPAKNFLASIHKFRFYIFIKIKTFVKIMAGFSFLTNFQEFFWCWSRRWVCVQEGRFSVFLFNSIPVWLFHPISGVRHRFL